MTSPPQPAPGQQPGGLVGSPAWPAPAQNLRHPLDPDVRPSTKATAVLVLGISAVLLMFCVGGAVPAVVALNLARSARDELDEAKGFLSGDRQLGLGVTMSWIALAISVAVLVIGLIVVLLTYGADPSPNFGDNVD